MLGRLLGVLDRLDSDADVDGSPPAEESIVVSLVVSVLCCCVVSTDSDCVLGGNSDDVGMLSMLVLGAIGVLDVSGVTIGILVDVMVELKFNCLLTFLG